MEVAHIVPPKWATAVCDRALMITFVPWVLKYPTYAHWLECRPPWSTLILNHGTFERDLTQSTVSEILEAWDAVRPDIVVLPDTLGDAALTLGKGLLAMQEMPRTCYLMFVPQARRIGRWNSLLYFFVQAVTRESRGFLIGLSSLRRETGLRAQSGSRIPMIRTLLQRGLQGHLLGLNSVPYFFEVEGPLAAKSGVIVGVDTCQAFALARKGLKFSISSPRLFLGDLEEYDDLTKEQLELALVNIDLFDKEVAKWS